MNRIIAVCLLLGIVSVYAQDEKYYGPDKTWNATPNDVNNMLKNLKGLIDADYHMDVKPFTAISSDPEKNPVLYRSGHYNFSYSQAERDHLRKYMLNGGMIIYNTGLGSQPFYRSCVREMKLIFPEQPIQRLSSDHPVFHAYYDVDRVNYTAGVYKGGYRGNEPWFDGVEINCRVVALVSKFGMAVGWEGTSKDEWQAYKPESATRLGVNIFAYASAMRAWAKNEANSMKFVDKEDVNTDKIAMVQLVYDGIWKTRHNGISVLLQTFNRKTTIPVKFGLKEMRLADERIFDAPLLFLTGHENFRFKKEEIIMLRQYLKNGGFLFAEACCGRKGFDLSFRQLVPMILPGLPLKKVPADNVLFNHPCKATNIGVTPTLMQEIGKNTTAPLLEGVEMDDHYCIIYSRLALQGGWEMSQSPYAKGYNDVGCMMLGQNILMYAVTQ